MPGVFTTFYHACRFEPCLRRKYQVLIHNCLRFDTDVGLLCSCAGTCDRTNRPHLSFKPEVKQGKIIKFMTGQEREYPRGFCEAYAGALQEEARCKGLTCLVFLEVFSGPNAPLSRAIAKMFNVAPPALLEHLSNEGFFMRSHLSTSCADSLSLLQSLLAVRPNVSATVPHSWSLDFNPGGARTYKLSQTGLRTQ